MKDIQSLLRRAKTGGGANLKAYIEAVELAERSDPVAYLSELEYIISSGAGYESFERFTEAHPVLPLAATRVIFETCGALLEKATEKQNDRFIRKYRELTERADQELNAHEHLLAMFEAFEGDLSGDYLSCLFEGTMDYRQALDRFGAGAVPDSLLGCFGGTVKEVLENAASHSIFATPEMQQWLVEASTDLLIDDPELEDQVNLITEASYLETAIQVKQRRQTLYREAVLTEQDLEIEVTADEIEALTEYATFQEYMVTALRTESGREAAYDEVCETYLELGRLLPEGESCADIAMLLPTGQRDPRLIAEARDQKTGRIPDFIAKNHDLSYGEEDDVPPAKEPKPRASEPVGSDPEEPYRRPKPDREEQLDDIDPLGKDDSSGKDKELDNASQQAVNNYYYNYYNSFNRNHRDDHSTHSRNSDNSSHVSNRDDHSVRNINAHGKSKNEPVTENAVDWHLDVPGTEQIITEGLKDTLVKFAKKIKGLFTLKKSLANVQRLDTPRMLKAKTPMTIPGTDIPLGKKLVTEAYGDELAELIRDGYFIAEAGSMDKPFGLSKNDVKNVIKKLRSKFKAEILFISNNNPSMASAIGLASVVMTDRASINDLVKGKWSQEAFPSPATTSDTSGFDKVILVNPKQLAEFKISTPRDLELIVSHEYGHVLTLDRFSQNDWLEYTIKRQILEGTIATIYGDTREAQAENTFAYYKLNIEAAANEATGIDPKELVYILWKVKPTGKLKWVDLDAIVNCKLPQSVLNCTKQTALGQQPGISDLLKNLNFSAELYKKAIRKPDVLKDTIDSIETMIRTMTSNFSEAAEFSPDENPIVPGTKFGFKLFKRNKPSPIIQVSDDYGFDIKPGTLDEDTISERLVKFMADRYQEDENKVIEAIKRLAEDEHHILGNVVMEPGLSTMWTDQYHIERMLFENGGNVVFEGDTGETILFEHIIGEREFDPAKVTIEKLDQLFSEYKIDRTKILDDDLKPEEISQWGRLEWGIVATRIFEQLSYPALKALELPADARLELFYDGSSWDDTIGANLIFTDIENELRTFNDQLGEGGRVTARRQTPLTESSDDLDDILGSTFSFTEKKKVEKESEPEPETEDPNADPERPTSDHPVRDTIQDIDRVLTRKGAEAKKRANNVVNVGKAVVKPVKRTMAWVDSMVNRLKDAKETKMKEELSDPHKRNAIFKAITASIKAGALLKAGLLLNPIFLVLAGINHFSNKKNQTRLVTDVIGQLKAEIEVTEEKIKDADRAGDRGAKYKLMRFKTELEKKLARVAGGNEGKRIL